MKELAILTDAVRMLAEAKSLEEIKHIHGLAQIAEAYARAEKLGKEAEAYAAEIRLRAARKAGEVLDKTPRHKGGRPTTKPVPEENRLNSDEEEIKLPDLGITRKQSRDWQTIAKADEEDFEETLAKAQTKRVTSDKAVADMLRKPRETPEPEDIAEVVTPTPSPTAAPEDRYSVIYADPPWEERIFKTEEDSKEYIMSLQEICDVPVPSIAADNAILFLWVTDPFLMKSQQVIEAWGFEYEATIVWDKETVEEPGAYINTQHEFLLVCTKGEMHASKVAEAPRSVVKGLWRSMEEFNDSKPVEMYNLIEQMYPEYDRIELFSRQNRYGWDEYFKEYEKEDKSS